ncbi:MAG: hypothetical protein R2848_04220 [Thermomicrobiales bacterium]
MSARSSALADHRNHRPRERSSAQARRPGGLSHLPVPPGVDGRQTVLSAVGMLPAAMCGVDIGGMLEGAAAMRERCKSTDIFENAAALFAAIAYLSDTTNGKAMLVMMPYADALFGIADWFRQPGQRVSASGSGRTAREVFAGQTPIKALGAIDQHSQIQLYTEGPNDKLLCLIGVDHYRAEVGSMACPQAFRSRVSRLARNWARCSIANGSPPPGR